MKRNTRLKDKQFQLIQVRRPPPISSNCHLNSRRGKVKKLNVKLMPAFTQHIAVHKNFWLKLRQEDLIATKKCLGKLWTVPQSFSFHIDKLWQESEGKVEISDIYCRVWVYQENWMASSNCISSLLRFWFRNILLIPDFISNKEQKLDLHGQFTVSIL